MKHGLIAGVIIAVLVLSGCGNYYHELIPSSDNKILSFTVPGQEGASVITEDSIFITANKDTDIRSLVPKITISDKAVLIPLTLDYIHAAFPSAPVFARAAEMYAEDSFANHIFDLISKDKNFQVPDLSIPIDFSSSVDFLVISGRGNIRRYTATLDAGELISVTITGLSAEDKVYDGTTEATISGTALIDGVLDGDEVSVNYGTAAFESADVGDDITVIFSGFSLGGEDAGKYTLSAQPASVTANIWEQSDHITFTDPSPNIVKTYGDAAFTNVVMGGYVGSGVITYSSEDESVATVDSNGTVTMHKTDTTVISAHKAADSGYAKSSCSYTLTVNPKPVTISGLSAEDKFCDGTTTATISGTASIDGLISGDDVSVNYGTAAFESAGVGNDITVIFSGFSLGGEDAGNYTLSAQPASVTANITGMPLSISGLSAVNKVYDGTTTATISGTALIEGLESGDEVTVNYGTAAFETANVGNGKTVIFSGFSLGGADADKYTLVAQPTATANITVKPVTITGLGAANKVYDGTTTATRTGTAVINGVISGDTVTVNYGTASFADKNVGNNKTVTFNDFSLGGADAGNYRFLLLTATANITPYSLLGNIEPSRTWLSPISGDNTINIALSLPRAETDTLNVTFTPTLPSGLTYNAGTRTITYNGTTAFTNPNAGSFSVVVGAGNSNYSNGTISFPINVYDGQADYTGTGYDRRIPLSNANIGAFNNYANSTNGLTRHYKLTQNITLAGTNNWTRIGTSSYPFTGSFDGQLLTITGINIEKPDVDYQGFFGFSSGMVRNLGLVGGSITGHWYVGGVVGYNSGTVQNCCYIGAVTIESYVYVAGGVVGYNSGTVQNCYATGAVNGPGLIGGVVGSNTNSGMVQNCYATSTVTFKGMADGDSRTSGVVGYNSGTVQNCYATGAVIGLNYLGGVVGSGGTVRNCVAMNPSVRKYSSYTIEVGRVGCAGGTFVNNYARNPMTVQYNLDQTTFIGTDKTITAGLNTVDGQNMTVTDAVTPSWWTAAGRWSTANGGTAWDFTNVWNPPSGTRLPTLRNMPAGTQNPVIQN